MSDLIVVGVDGSVHSERALAWAVETARLRGAPLELVSVYGRPEILRDGGVTDVNEFLERPRIEAQHLLAGLADAITDVPVRVAAVQDQSPAHALVERAKDAALLVVSARGNGPLKRLLLGSVSTQVAHLAECPVAIVR